jgi:hypothetical protein
MDVLYRNMAFCETLGFSSWKPERSRLAVIGGASSIADHVEEMKNFDGDRLIVAGAWKWCQDRWIDGAFFSVDPQAFIADLAKPRPEKALVASCSDAAVFAALSGAAVSTFEVKWNEKMNHCGTTVTAGFWLGMEYQETVFYGCDSSYGAMSHAYEDGPHKLLLQVKCNGEIFVTDPLMLMQAEFMSTVLRKFPETFKSRSGGLLQAMIVEGDYEVVGGNRAAMDWLGIEEAA